MKKSNAAGKTIATLFLFFILNSFPVTFLDGISSADTGSVKIRLKKIESEIFTAVKSWKISTNNKDWKSYHLLFPIDRERFTLKTVIPGAAVFAGAPVKGTPLYLKLDLQALGFCRVKTAVNGQAVDEFTADAADGAAIEMTRKTLIAKTTALENYEVRIEVINSGFTPPRTDYWPPRKKRLNEEGIFFKFKNAEIDYPRAAPIRRKIVSWLTSMKTADNLLNPDLRLFTFTGKPFPIADNRKITSSRLKELNDTLARSVLAFDYFALKKGAGAKLETSIEKSYKLAAPLRQHAQDYNVYLIGNAHIDIAWLWRIYETAAVARSTFDSVIDNMADFPELRFAQSQAITYIWMEEKYPEIFKKIKRLFQAGKWEIVGGMWVEPDCNLISGESWVRQLLYGKNYFKEKFGCDVKTGWNVDSFGYNWNMPQIYKKCGIDRFVTQKLWWNDTTIFPYFIFWWQGVDGSRLLSYFPPASYTSRVEIAKVSENIAKYEASTGYKKSLILYGLGNHGGGPNREILNRVRDYEKLYIAPRFILSKSRDFLENIKKDLGENIPVWNDELYLEYHRGTFTAQAKVKKGNRQCESAAATAEKLAAVAAMNGSSYPQKELEAAWKLVLTNQFHDILPGSSITPVYRDALEFYDRALTKIRRVEKEAAADIAGKIDTTGIKTGNPLVVFNPLSWRRSGFVTVSYPHTGAGDKTFKILDAKGNEIPVEIEEEAESRLLRISFIAADMPPLGYRVFSLVKGKSPGRPAALNVRGATIENKFYRITVNPRTGNMTSIYDKAQRREFIARGQEANILQIYEDRAEQWDAWNIGYTGRMWELNRAEAVEIVRRSPVRVTLRIKKSFLGLSKKRLSPTEYFPSSFFTQYITLYRDLDTVDIKTEADWWEDHALLKAAFPVNVKSDTAAYEIPYAAIHRTTKFKTLWEKARFEAPALKWADLSAAGFGISLLNDCKYGYDIHGNVMKISLLRAPLWPDPTADRGKHTFTYALYTHKGRWNEAETVRRGYELNNPMVTVFSGRHKGIFPPEFSFFQVQATGVILDTLKKEEKGDGLIVRLYEAHGRDERAALRFYKAPRQVYETDLLENKVRQVKTKGAELMLDFKKYEIKTLLIFY